jgi:hypothetical protein
MFPGVRSAALAAPAILDDAGTVPVGTENAIIRVERVFRSRTLHNARLKAGSALDAVTAFERDEGPALGASLSGEFLMTMGTFHDSSQLFLEVVT